MAGKSRRGFASMDPAKQREIASKGGRAAHSKGTAHEWTSDEARNAGRKGGEVVSRDRAHMAAIGREGGEARGRKARLRTLPGQSNDQSQNYVDREAGVPVSREVPGMAAGADVGASQSAPEADAGAAQNSGAQQSSINVDASRAAEGGSSSQGNGQELNGR